MGVDVDVDELTDAESLDPDQAVRRQDLGQRLDAALQGHRG